MNKCLLSISTLVLSVAASSAGAQVATLYNPGFETTFPGFETFAAGWRQYQSGQTLRREIGDGLTPATQVHRGIASVRLPGGNGNPGGEFQAVQSEEIVPDTITRNWPQYTFDPVAGAPIYLSCWYMIPADDPMVGTKFGMKVNFLRNAPGNQSIYREREWLDVDPDTTIAPPCGTFVVDLPGNVKGIHTNGQWVRFHVSVDQPTDFNDPATQMPYPIPPTNPAPASIFALRFGPDNTGTGTVWVDDMRFSQTPPCLADFNGDDVLSVQDIFDFLNAWFAGSCFADYNHINGLGVQDIFDYLNSWFAGCPSS
ncbi:MAG TPA: GC-type dockerin domain-anchored protein [Phycisphaerales bacterium]|nr:GC-type dockerin domain-anchored protein [Phycisphaerales bacterium]